MGAVREVMGVEVDERAYLSIGVELCWNVSVGTWNDHARPSRGRAPLRLLYVSCFESEPFRVRYLGVRALQGVLVISCHDISGTPSQASALPTATVQYFRFISTCQTLVTGPNFLAAVSAQRRVSARLQVTPEYVAITVPSSRKMSSRSSKFELTRRRTRPLGLPFRPQASGRTV